MRYAHGTEQGYRIDRCHCDLCTEAWRIVCAERKAKRLARPIPEEVHGTYNGATNYGCHCYLCREARSSYDRIRRWTREEEKADAQE